MGDSGSGGELAIVWNVGPPVPRAYGFVGFLRPLVNDGSATFESGRTIPIKFQLVDANGTSISTAAATLHVFRMVGDVAGTTDEAPAGASFRRDADADQYVFNLGTAALGPGTFLLRVTLDDGSAHEVRVTLRERPIPQRGKRRTSHLLRTILRSSRR